MNFKALPLASQDDPDLTGPLYHVTALSYFAYGYDTYGCCYSRNRVPKGDFPVHWDIFKEKDLKSAVDQASIMLMRIGCPEDSLLVIQTRLPKANLLVNPRTGRESIWPESDLPVFGLYRVNVDGAIGRPVPLEEALAQSRELHPND